jgi:tetratricopeptide (TPR) repeat protein
MAQDDAADENTLSESVFPVEPSHEHVLEVVDEAAHVQHVAEPQPEAPVRERGTFWGRLRTLLFGDADDFERRLMALNQAIENADPTPTNHVLRGELYLELGAYSEAFSDFEYAEKLASYQLDAHNWGLIAQAMRDRALAGMAKAQRHLQAVSETQTDGHEPHQNSHDHD